jgi:hypothetical protein
MSVGSAISLNPIGNNLPESYITGLITDLARIKTMNTGVLHGRSSVGIGVVEEIAVGTGLSLSAGTLINTAPAPSPLTTQTIATYSSTITPTTANTDVMALAQTGPTAITAIAGTPLRDGQVVTISIMANGAYAITYDSSLLSGSSTLPTTTVTNKLCVMGFKWFSTRSKWYLVALWQEA